MPSKMKIHILPEELVLPFVAAWRVLEKSVNPVFSFPMKCNSCGKMSENTQSQGPAFVLSNKQKNGMPVLIGIQCKTEGCDMVVKFEKPISPGDESFPARLQKYPKSALSEPDGVPGKISTKGLEEIKTLLDLE